MSPSTDLTVHGADVPIAVRDHGGDGPDLLLLHGAGGNLDDWRPILPQLNRFRTVSVDLRGHGNSGDGTWNAESILADLSAVVARLGLRRPLVLGHSLGGMIAAHWAVRHPDCPAAISLDGHRSAQTHPRHYHGIAAERRDADLAALAAMFKAQSAAMDDPLPDSVATVVSPRGLVKRDGRTYLRVGRETAEAMRSLDWFVDCLPIIAKVTTPFLVVMATQDPPGTPPQFGALMDAYRAGLRADFAKLATTCPQLSVTEVAAGHGMVAHSSATVAGVVTEFLNRVR